MRIVSFYSEEVERIGIGDTKLKIVKGFENSSLAALIQPYQRNHWPPWMFI